MIIKKKPQVLTGLEKLKTDPALQKKYSGNIGYVCHGASIDKNYKLGIPILQGIFKSRLTKIFSPQHGLFADKQDDMIESDHFVHPYFQLPVFSLYSEIRKPTGKMLEGLDCVFIDMQDVGTRIYTYIYTMTLFMDACAEKDIRVIILDRPNPINGQVLEGNVLDLAFKSFVGLHPLPVRHGMTMGEIALMAKQFWKIDCDLEVIKMYGWKRSMDFEDTGLPWVLPSPNLATVEAAFTFPSAVIYEGTNLSEGRGTTRSLEIIGHPAIEPFSLAKHLGSVFNKAGLFGFALRPLLFEPTFQKHAGKTCGGFQIHVTDRTEFKPWKVGQVLCREFYHYLGEEFQWKLPPYEYETEKMPIDVINGTDKLRKWVEGNGTLEDLIAIEQHGYDEFNEQRKEVLLYA